MIGISRQTDYAVRIVLHLACMPPGSQVSIREVAAHRQLPVPFVRRLVARMVAKGILQTTRGSAGGVQLGRSSAAISLLDVVEAMEGPIVLNPCVEHEDACPFSGTCPVHLAWDAAGKTLASHLAGIRFQDLAHAEPGHAAAHAAGTASTPSCHQP